MTVKTATTTNTGKTFIGRVVSDKMTGTIVVSLSYKTRHPLYKKIVNKNKKIYSEIPFIPNNKLKPEDIGKATYIAYTISKEQKDENENSEAKI